MQEPAQPPAHDRGPTSSSSIRKGRSADLLAYTDVMDALYDLDRLDRLALRLIYWNGLTQAQVADELRVPVATVRRGVARGMRLLSTRLRRRAEP